MALARIGRTGLRRSVSAIGSQSSGKDIFCEGVFGYKYFLPSLENAKANSHLSYLSSIGKLNHMSFWSRGLRGSPYYQFPLAERVLEEHESEYEEQRYPGLEATKPGEKPRVVVLGTGWAACRFLKGLDTKTYDAVCIAPRNHMVFTPLLASTCVGTLEFRSVAEPVNRIQTALATNPNSHFYLASCIGLDTKKHEVSPIQSLLCFIPHFEVTLQTRNLTVSFT